jgi:hypothetical protein
VNWGLALSLYLLGGTCMAGFAYEAIRDGLKRRVYNQQVAQEMDEMEKGIGRWPGAMTGFLIFVFVFWWYVLIMLIVAVVRKPPWRS